MGSIIKTDEDIRYILRGIVDLTLPKPKWTHEAHLAAALAIINDKNYDALTDMPRIIKAYNEATGVKNTDHSGYHHTITIASLMAVKAHMGGGLSSLSEAFFKLVQSDYGKSTWLLSYWSKDVLFSVEARKTWVEPNLSTLPFKT